MCGIAGVISKSDEGLERPIVERMVALLRHRGPDGYGLESRDRICFGHRRLSIIDFEGGAQPMFSVDERFLITFNGEVFNYLELRGELNKLGAKFQTRSDTEVILEGYRFWGIDLLAKLNGQFAFALYDSEKKQTLLARDPLGEKPLFFFEHSRCFAFASELKSLVALKKSLGQSLEVDPKAFSDFLSLNYVPFQRSFFSDVSQLTPGSYLLISENGPTKVGRYSTICDNVSDYGIDTFDSLLEQAVRLRLRSDAPIGVFLSGGIDSTIVAGAVSRLTSNCKAFIADFDEPGFTEAEYAETVGNKLGLDCERVPIRLEQSSLEDLIISLVNHGDTPLADSSSLAVFLLSRETSKNVKVVLSGDGGDELFAGYLTYAATKLSEKLGPRIRVVLSLLHPVFRILRYGDGKVGFPEKLERFFRCLQLSPAEAHFAWNGMFHASDKPSLIHPRILEALSNNELNTFKRLKELYQLDDQKPSIRSLQDADIQEYLSSDILQKVDRMTMAHGLEVRPVLLDPNIVHFSKGLEESQIFRGFQGKVFLRSYIRRQLPWYDLSRPKQGFSIPIHRWFRTSLYDFFADLIHSQDAREFELFNLIQVQKLLDRHKQRKLNLGFELWGVMVTLLWARQFLRSEFLSDQI